MAVAKIMRGVVAFLVAKLAWAQLIMVPQLRLLEQVPDLRASFNIFSCNFNHRHRQSSSTC
jgi:hypothetical protein